MIIVQINYACFKSSLIVKSHWISYFKNFKKKIKYVQRLACTI